MAQIVEFVGNDPDSGKLFTLGSDVVVATAASVAPATNRKSIFAASFSGVAVGEYQFIALDGAEGDAIWTVAITSADGVFTAYERTVNTSAGASNGTVTRSLTDTEPIQFAWPVTGATLTGEVDFNSANDYQAVSGTFDFLYTEGGVHYYTLAHNAADRPTTEGTARYKVTDGVRTKWFNLRMAVSSSGGGGDGAWTEEDVTYALEKLALLGVVADAVVVPAGTFMCGRGDIEQIFGTTAVAKWGDLNNNEDADEITGRINYRIAIADSFMRSTLGNSAWVLPLEGDEIPPILAYYTACLAGVLLYEGRGVQDYDARGNAQHQLSFHKKGVDDFVKGVLFGAVSLAPLEYNVASAAPEAT